METILNTNLSPKSSIVILTGAGISAESGLETFRGTENSAGGLWCGHRVEDVATPEAFARNPALVHEFYNMRRSGLLGPAIKPNPAHNALARLEREWKGNVLVVTQNIDDLHERAGTRNLIHMHGEVLRAFCHFCHHKTDARDDLSTAHTCTQCERVGGVRPDIVWFGEMPYEMDRIFDALSDADLFISVGTSGHVYPAAGFVNHARQTGAVTAEFNLDPSNNASMFHESVYGPAGSTLPVFVERLLSGI